MVNFSFIRRLNGGCHASRHQRKYAIAADRHAHAIIESMVKGCVSMFRLSRLKPATTVRVSMAPLFREIRRKYRFGERQNSSTRDASFLNRFVALVIFVASHEKSQNPQKERHGIGNRGPSPGGSCHQLLSFRCDAAR